MAKQLQLRKGTDTEHNTFTGALGEVTVDTTNKTLRVHDGVTVGGIRLATLSSVVLNNTLTSTSTAQALTAAQGKVLNDQAFGVGQTWQDFTGSRSSGVTYTNNTGKPIQVVISVFSITGAESNKLIVGGVTLLDGDLGVGGMVSIQSFIVPSGVSYVFTTTAQISSWAELR